MKRPLIAFAAGVIFALGLGIAGMMQPAKVTAFLNITGDWDPSLAFVMVGAIGVYAMAWQLSQRRIRPLVEDRFLPLPPARIDLRLGVGAALFGLGWGLAGYCPGPAVASLASGAAPALTFGGAMLAGVLLMRLLDPRVSGSAGEVKMEESCG